MNEALQSSWGNFLMFVQLLHTTLITFQVYLQYMSMHDDDSSLCALKKFFWEMIKLKHFVYNLFKA